MATSLYHSIPIAKPTATATPKLGSNQQQNRYPVEECVDYLSYDFNAFDLFKTWSHATKHKDHITNGRRLENASWRKFFQVRFGLKRVDPSKLNWQKDSDVVWLYGPFVGYEPLHIIQAEAEEPEFKVTTLKPALKKRPEPEDFFQKLRDIMIHTRNQDLLEPDANPVTPSNSYLTPPSGQRPDFFLSNKPVRKTNSLNETAADDALAQGDLALSGRKASFLGGNTNSFSENLSSKHIRFNERVEQAQILDADADTLAPLSARKPPKPATRQKAFSMGDDDDDDDDDDDEDFRKAGAINKSDRFAPAYSSGALGDIKASSSIPISIKPEAIVPSSSHSSSQSSNSSFPFSNSPASSHTNSTHSHSHDEIDAVVGAVVGGTDWNATASVGSGLLRRTQSEGNNFYILARRLPETPPPSSLSNYTTSSQSSTQSGLQRGPSDGSSHAENLRRTSRVSGVTAVSAVANGAQLPRVGSGLLPMVQLPPIQLKSDDEDDEEEEEEEDDIIQSKLAARLASAHHRGSPPPTPSKILILDESDSSEDNDEEEGIMFGESKQAKKPSDSEEKTEEVTSPNRNSMLEAYETDVKQSSPSGSPGANITTSIVRTRSWMASTYPSSARSLGHLIYGPDIELHPDTGEIHGTGSDTEDPDLGLDPERLKAMWEECTEQVDRENQELENPLQRFADVEVEEITHHKASLVDNILKWASNIGKRWSYFGGQLD